MINQELLKYIGDELSKGTSRDIIQNNLISQGWSMSDINEGFFALGSKTTTPKINIQGFVSPQEKTKHSFALITILILFAIGGGVFAYYKYMLIKEKSINITETINTTTQASTTQDIISNPDIATTSQQNFSTTTQQSGNIECGTNMTCFINAAKTCSIASVETSIVIDLGEIFGFISSTTNNLQLKGLDTNKECIIYNRTDNIDLIVRPDIPVKDQSRVKAQIEQNLESTKKIIGQTFKCTSKNLPEILTNWTKGFVNSDDFPEGNCTIVK